MSHDRRVAGQAEDAVAGTEERDQLVVDDLDDLLAGGQAREHVRADGLLADAGHEVLDDLEVDVRLEQGEPDLAHGGIHVGLADPAAAGQVAEGRSKALAEGVEHGPIRTPVVGDIRAGRDGCRGRSGGARVLTHRGVRSVPQGPAGWGRRRPDRFRLPAAAPYAARNVRNPFSSALWQNAAFVRSGRRRRSRSSARSSLGWRCRRSWPSSFWMPVRSRSRSCARSICSPPCCSASS